MSLRLYEFDRCANMHSCIPLCLYGFDGVAPDMLCTCDGRFTFIDSFPETSSCQNVMADLVADHATGALLKIGTCESRS